MPKLYEISNELAAILGSAEDELDPDAEQKLADLAIALEVKIENILQFRQGILSDAEAIKAEADRLKARADAINRRADWLKGYVQSAMDQTGIRKLSTRTFTASICNSPPKVELEDGAEIPTEYRREKVDISLDRAAVLADYKANKPLPAGVVIKQGAYLKIS